MATTHGVRNEKAMADAFHTIEEVENSRRLAHRLQAARSNIDALDDAIQELNRRLQPVLDPSPRGVGGELCKQEETSPMGAEIDAMGRHAAALRENVVALLDRLEV